MKISAKALLPVVISSSMLMWAETSHASLLYTDFSDTTELTLNGTAATHTPNSDNVLRLTAGNGQAGSAFSTSAINLNSDVSFSSAFDFRIHTPTGISDGDGQGADGIVFAIQTNANTAGGGGGGIGYAGILNSVGIEFDTWNNGGVDGNNGNHVGINLNGSVDSVVRANIDQRMNNGDVWHAWIDYNGLIDDLQVRLSTTDIRPTDALLSYNVDLTTILGASQAFAGFTSGTGAAGGSHDINNWQFVDNFAPIGGTNEGSVPLPPTALLMFAGVAGLAATRRKKSHALAA